MATEQKHRPLSVNDREIEVLKIAFASSDGDYQILKIVRSLFLGFPISTSDATLVKSVFKDPEVKLALRKKMYPILSNDVGIGEESDFWFGTETEILDKPPESIKQIVDSKQGCLDMLEQAFRLLDDPSGKKINLSYNPHDKNDDPFHIWLLTRNKYVKVVVTGLTIVKVIAGQKSESVKDAKERLMKDSTK